MSGIERESLTLLLAALRHIGEPRNSIVAACALGFSQLAVQRNPRTSACLPPSTDDVGAAGDDRRLTDVGTAAPGKGAAANDRRKGCFTLETLQRRARSCGGLIAFAPF